MKKLIVTASLLLSMSAPFASAYSLVTSEVIKGVVENVDVTKREVVLVSNAGFQKVVSLAPDARVSIEINGENSSDISSLAKGREVRIVKKTLIPTDDTIEGVIVSIDNAERTAKVRKQNGDVVRVKFSQGLLVRNHNETLAFADLRRGQEVVVSKVN